MTEISSYIYIAVSLHPCNYTHTAVEMSIVYDNKTRFFMNSGVVQKKTIDGQTTYFVQRIEHKRSFF